MVPIVISSDTTIPLYMSYQISYAKDLQSLDRIYSTYHAKFSNITWSLFFHRIHTFLAMPSPHDEKKLKDTAFRNISYLKKAADLKIEFPNHDEECIRYIYSKAIGALFPEDAEKSTIVRTYDILNLGNA